jgi:hypothetical protein
MYKHLAGAAVSIIFAATFFTSAGAGGARPLAFPGAKPRGLTTPGKIVWQLDAVLHDTFGARKVCLGPHPVLNFQSRCSPSSNYTQYLPTFSAARRSSWRLTSASPSSLVMGTFETVQVEGKYVRCGLNSWLVSLPSQLPPFACSPP